MIKTDVAIIGAGPGGSIAAHRLSSEGVKVVLLEQGTFPRDKTCGDAVTAEGLEALERTGLGQWITRFPVIRTLRFSGPNGNLLDIDVQGLNGRTIGRLIPRRLMDNQIAQASVAAGTNLLDGTRVRKVAQNGNAPPRITAGGVEVEAQMIILADGSHAPITRQMGLMSEQFDLIAVRQYLAGDSEPDGPLEFHFQPDIIPGYTWQFSLGDGHLNIGAGTYSTRTRSKEVDLKAVLERFKAHHPVNPGRLKNTEPIGPIKGHPLRTNVRGTRTHAHRVLVVGDAAGLVSPFTGEGIASAMRSGEMAAEQVLVALRSGDFSEQTLAPYTHRIRQRYSGDQAAGRFLRSTLKAPSLLNRFLQRLKESQPLRDLFAHVYLDERSPRLLLRPSTLLRLLF
jgi:geranylgeranyl reductase family protein